MSIQLIYIVKARINIEFVICFLKKSIYNFIHDLFLGLLKVLDYLSSKNKLIRSPVSEQTICAFILTYTVYRNNRSSNSFTDLFMWYLFDLAFGSLMSYASCTCIFIYDKDCHMKKKCKNKCEKKNHKALFIHAVLKESLTISIYKCLRF